MARFGLLAGTVSSAEETLDAFALSATGWALVLAPFVVLVAGMAVGALRRSEENEDAVADLVT
jgi:hypothetical protein